MGKRIVVIDRELCNPERCNRECVKFCPVNRLGKECIRIEKIAVIDESLCIGCGICTKKCPFKAITVINLPFEEEEPVFSYGKNAFRLYNLPIPERGGNVFLGRNGIGKTTALNILAGKIKVEVEKPEWKKFLQKEKKVSYKIQNIAELRKLDVTVEDLFSRFSLSLPNEMLHLAKRKLSQLSGGELQKVAIEISLRRDAQIYFIDEPTNYLDIEERMRYALKIREKADSSTIIVVEHDLTIADYIAEYGFIFFGEPSAFGFVSGIKVINRAVNEYLLGYLKEENIRFRSYEVNFKKLMAKKERKEKIFLTYDGFSTKRGEFALHAKAGEIREGEIIGIVGKNGIGKTTFLDELSNKLDLEISYKKQYLEYNGDETVEEFLSSGERRIYGMINNYWEIEKLRYKKVKNLSMGELQKVFIAKTLMQDSQLYFLDEPSAFLDVESKLRLLNILLSFPKKECAFFIVDHDLLFIDVISDRIIKFDGESGKEGFASSPLEKKEGLNVFMKSLDITVRRDPSTLRPKINKPGSQKDREQREKEEWFELL